MHIADLDTGNLGANGIVGGGIPIGVGAALGIKLRGSGQIVAIFFSDGASNNGVFAESLNLAAIWDLPAIFVLENNQYAVSTPIDECSRLTDLSLRGKGYGVDSCELDGNDVVLVYERTVTAVEKCRRGQGPVLLCARTYRKGGHHVNDPGLYMPRERLAYYEARDPLLVCKERLGEVACDPSECALIERDVDSQIEQAVEFARNSPEPSVEAFLQEMDRN
jgi:pyruvate dehydrogenase E1 component alpha subunit